MFIALYNMADRSMQGRTALNIIEIASFRRSSRCAKWRGDETNTSPLKFNLQFVNTRKHFNAFSSYISEETRHYFCTIGWFVYFIVHGHIANDFHICNTYHHEFMRITEKFSCGLNFAAFSYIRSSYVSSTIDVARTVFTNLSSLDLPIKDFWSRYFNTKDTHN